MIIWHFWSCGHSVVNHFKLGYKIWIIYSEQAVPLPNFLKKKNPDYLDTQAKCLDSFKWSCDLSEENVLEMSYMFHLYL